MTRSNAMFPDCPAVSDAEAPHPVFNVFQIIFLNLVGGAALTLAALILNMHWMNAMVIGWLGGGVFALMIVTITLGLAQASARQLADVVFAAWDRDARQDRARFDRQQAVRMWEADLQADQRAARIAHPACQEPS